MSISIPFPENFSDPRPDLFKGIVPASREDIEAARSLADLSRKPTVPEVLPLVQTLYRHNAVGGYLHIVLDDGNISNGCLQFCANLAAFYSDEFSYLLAMILLKMSLTQRNKIYNSQGKRA